MNRNKDYATSFLEYMQMNKDKYAIIISKQQYAISIEQSKPHENMLRDLIDLTRPDLNADKFGNTDNKFEDDTIVIMGYPGYMQVQLPNQGKISLNQYDCLSEILYYVINNNYEADSDYSKPKYSVLGFSNDGEKVPAKYYEEDIKDFLELAKLNIEEPIYLPQEIIIGRQFDVLNTVKDPDTIIKQMENNTIDVNGNPILGNDHEYMLKGYSDHMLLILITLVASLIVILVGAFIKININ